MNNYLDKQGKLKTENIQNIENEEEEEENHLRVFFFAVNVPYLNVHSWRCDKQMKKLRVAWQLTTWYSTLARWIYLRRDEKSYKTQNSLHFV